MRRVTVRRVWILAFLAAGFVSGCGREHTPSEPPLVDSTAPVNGATNVPVNQQIAAIFSQAMNSATITSPGTFTLAVAGVGGAAVPGTVTYVAGSNTATFTPTANLLPSAQY